MYGNRRHLEVAALADTLRCKRFSGSRTRPVPVVFARASIVCTFASGQKTRFLKKGWPLTKSKPKPVMMKTMTQQFRNKGQGISSGFNRCFRTLSLILFFSIIYGVGQVTAQCEQLVWQDEFNGPGIDASKWDMEVGGGGWGTGQLDYATNRPENARIENGKLVLEIRKEDYQGHQYTSGRMRTYKKVDFQYGRIEARVKGVYSQGNGFAFWLLGSDYESIWWPKSGEVDIFENTGKFPGKNIGTSHYEEAGDMRGIRVHTPFPTTNAGPMPFTMQQSNGVRPISSFSLMESCIILSTSANRSTTIVLSTDRSLSFLVLVWADHIPDHQMQLPYPLCARNMIRPCNTKNDKERSVERTIVVDRFLIIGARNRSDSIRLPRRGVRCAEP